MKIYDFFMAIISKLKGETTSDNSMLTIEELATDKEPQCNTSLEEVEYVQEELKKQMSAAKRTLLTRLYTLEQEISIFKEDFPSEYQAFLERIERLRDAYTSSLEELKKSVTFEIDPESSTDKRGEVIKLEKDIKKFIESTVKFHIISKRLQRLIKKLNILYNVSISHPDECEKEKVRMQLERAIQSERQLAKEFKESHYVVSDNQRKERIIELLSYADYEIFKTYLRNSNQTPETLIGKLVMLEEFAEFDYATTFVSYLKDELSDLQELLLRVPKLSDKSRLETQVSKIKLCFIYSNDVKEVLHNVKFWNEFFDFESMLLETLKWNKVPEEIATVKLLDKMEIKVEENEVLVLPITNATLALLSIFSRTHDEHVLLMIKLLEGVSKEITYREIYFLLLLFDAMEVVKNTPNDLIEHLEKYIVKHPYTRREVIRKREQAKDILKQYQYITIFHLDDMSDEIINTLKQLEIDFKVENEDVLINSVYFGGLEHLSSNLETNIDTNNWITEV